MLQRIAVSADAGSRSRPPAFPLAFDLAALAALGITQVAAVVGVAQLVAAVFPGSSRSGTTILACLALGLSRPAATEFSFLVGIPTMLAASGLKIVKALLHPAAGAASENWSAVGLGFVVSALVSFVVVRWLLGYVRNHTFAAFGWYRIALALVIFALVRG